VQRQEKLFSYLPPFTNKENLHYTQLDQSYNILLKK